MSVSGEKNERGKFMRKEHPAIVALEMLLALTMLIHAVVLMAQQPEGAAWWLVLDVVGAVLCLAVSTHWLICRKRAGTKYLCGIELTLILVFIGTALVLPYLSVETKEYQLLLWAEMSALQIRNALDMWKRKAELECQWKWRGTTHDYLILAIGVFAVLMLVHLIRFGEKAYYMSMFFMAASLVCLSNEVMLAQDDEDKKAEKQTENSAQE